MKIELSIQINASIQFAWKALITPSIIKEYLYGTEVSCDWEIGNPILFKGNWKGTSYEDKGVIKEIEEHKTLEYTYYSSLSSVEDLPENYMLIRFELSENKNGVEVRLTQSNFASKEQAAHSAASWQDVLKLYKLNTEKLKG